MGIKIEFKGVNKVNAAFKKNTDEYVRSVRNELERFGNNTVTQAKRLTPVDEGFLRNSIAATFPIAQKGLAVDIIVAANYAAFVEFGTRKFAAAYVSALPNEWQTFAAKFKGKTAGTFDEFVMRLTKWVLRKGIGSKTGKQSKQTTAEADAYAIALYIVRNGSKPHPFLYPAVRDNKKILIDKLKAL